jgi:heterotetrameric sarcosine oxidase alpha subunit
MREERAKQAGQPYRLAQGGEIDRSRVLRGRFDGRAIEGFAGDTLASALLANGVRLVARSFKYHRPRGILSAGSEEPNALVELRSGSRREPNTRATVAEFYDGLEARSQNHWPSLRFDLLAANGLLSPALGAGFYYKTFMWPPSFWERLYEPLIRRAAGLGRAAGLRDPDSYEHDNAFCDVLVIGSGPSGLAAALVAGRAGARVVLCEEDFRFGGRLLGDSCEIDGMPGHLWAARTIEELRAVREVRLLSRTTVFGIYDGATYGALERVCDHMPVPPPHAPRQRVWRIVAKQAVLAAGAIERPMVFAGNDRPGIMLACALRTYTNRFAVACGRRIALFVNNDDAWRSAADLARCGVVVSAVIDTRGAVAPEVRAHAGAARVITGATVLKANGGTALRSVTVRSKHGTETIAADALGISGGWNPNVHLTCHKGARPVWSERIAAFVSGTPPAGMRVAGAASGSMTLAACLRAGAQEGYAAAEQCGFHPKPLAAGADDEPCAVDAFWHVDAAATAFIDFQNDVTATDIALAEREGFRSAEHLKRYTTLGMATDQGKIGNMHGLAALATLTGRSIQGTGTTTFRPPYTPVAIGAFAGPHRGKHFRPARLTPSHRWAQEQGAIFVEAGTWLRARYFPKPGERDWLTTVDREVETVRSAVGFCDVSTLGKIEVHGPDAGAFLDRLYINTFSTLPVGRVRYGVMLREDGFVLDDGTCSRFAPDRFFMTTTTANAERVYQHMQFCHQVLWPELDVQFVSATDQWVQFSVAGPRSREVLAELVTPFDLSNAAFPYMAACELTITGDIPARLYRLSFSGELAYEIAVPARYGDGLARLLMQTSAAFGIAPYGTEALGVMRIEKGHVGGQEIDGRTTARDLGFGRMMSTKKDFIGRVMAGRPALLEEDRRVFVGFKTVFAEDRIAAGAHIVAKGMPLTAAHDEGVLTSVAFSPSLQHWIALGLFARGRGRLGERVIAADPVRERFVEVEVCAPCFIDPEGARLHA